MGKYAIEVEAKNQTQANTIQESLGDKETRAFVIVVGVLKNLPTKRAKSEL